MPYLDDSLINVARAILRPVSAARGSVYVRFIFEILSPAFPEFFSKFSSEKISEYLIANLIRVSRSFFNCSRSEFFIFGSSLFFLLK